VTEPENSKSIKFGIAFKLGLILAAFGVLASGVSGYYSYTAGRALVIKLAEQGLLTSTHVLGRRLSIALGEVANDVRFLARIPAIKRISLPSGNLPVESQNVLADSFAAMLSVHPEYFQIRLISADQNGIELVRLDRDRGKLARVTGMDLQDKGHYPYVFQSLRLAAGKIYLSEIAINHEQGAHSGLEKPTLRVATPVKSPTGGNSAVVVVNVDLNSLFSLLKADLPYDFRLFLSNEAGDFLIHPDASQTFGFDRGRRILVQDAFEGASSIVEGKAQSAVMTVSASERQPDKVLAAFIKLPYGDTASNRFVILGLTQPLENVLRDTRLLGLNIIQMVLLFSIPAIILAVIVSRAMTGPLNMMVRAAKRFSEDHVTIDLPLERKDELGLLARGLREMQTQIQAHLSELYESQRDIDHLAHHDALTGLANRLMFNARLEHAIANSQRTDKNAALIFIDLDSFKEINDSHGHAVGDKVLKAVATRLKGMVREVDTVARMGGDELIVLIEAIDDPHVRFVAQKLIEGFRPPIHVDGKDLQIGISIGISIYPRDGNSPSELLNKADLAMYRSKKAGGNTFHFYAAEMAPAKTG